MNSGTAEQRNSGTAEASDGVVSQSIYALKGLAIIGVVLQHISSARFPPETLNNIWTFVQVPFLWCVLLFFAISGYLHALSEEQRPKSIEDFLKNRTKRLLIPFVVFLLPFALFSQLLVYLNSIITGAPLKITVFASLFTMTTKPFIAPFIGDGHAGAQTYFLIYLFFISLIAHISLRLAKNAIWVLAVTSLTIGITLIPHQLINNITGGHFGTLTYGLFSYTGGFLLYKYRNTNLRFAAVTSVTFTSFAFLGFSTSGLTKMFPLLLLLFAPYLQLQKAPSLIKLGEASGSIFIYHVFILNPFITLIAKFAPIQSQFLLAILSGIFSLILCAAFYFLVRKTRFKRILM